MVWCLVKHRSNFRLFGAWQSAVTADGALRHRVSYWESISKQGEEVAEGWTGLQNEELHNLYTSSNIIGVMKSRRKAGHVARVGEMRNA
jgi:hypothetical protein